EIRWQVLKSPPKWASRRSLSGASKESPCSHQGRIRRGLAARRRDRCGRRAGTSRAFALRGIPIFRWESNAPKERRRLDEFHADFYFAGVSLAYKCDRAG